MRMFEVGFDADEVVRHIVDSAKLGFLTGINRESSDYRNTTNTVVKWSQDRGTSLCLTRDAIPGELFGWHLSVCGVTQSGFREMDYGESEFWAGKIFRTLDGLFRFDGPLHGSRSRHFVRPVGSWEGKFAQDPNGANNLEKPVV